MYIIFLSGPSAVPRPLFDFSTRKSKSFDRINPLTPSPPHSLLSNPTNHFLDFLSDLAEIRGVLARNRYRVLFRDFLLKNFFFLLLYWQYWKPAWPSLVKIRAKRTYFLEKYRSGYFFPFYQPLHNFLSNILYLNFLFGFKAKFGDAGRGEAKFGQNSDGKS